MWMNMTYALIAGIILDFILGDPYILPHPVRLMGRWIGWLDRKLYRETLSEKSLFLRGGVLVLCVLLPSVLCPAVILWVAYQLHPFAGNAAAAVMCYQMLAAKCLKTESMKVYTALKTEGLLAARYAVSMIVGRDTSVLDETGVTKAAVETVAENTSDGCIAPLFYMALGGPVLGFLYKAVNTMDSMVGYKNDRYMYFGRIAAKLDDIANFIPSRLAGLFMVAAAYIGGFNGKQAFLIFKRDRFKHASLNSAQTEAACAGALGIQLAGDAVYFGKKVTKPTLGDALRPVEPEDIRRADQLLYLTVILSAVIFILIRIEIGVVYGTF